jgi:hypothetical protein
MIGKKELEYASMSNVIIYRNSRKQTHESNLRLEFVFIKNKCLP